MSVHLAVIGSQRPFVFEALEREFTLHKVWEAPDKLAALEPVADRIRGVVSNGMAGLPTALIDALPNLEICALNGVGLETTDLASAKRRGIVVTTTPVLYDDVADIGILLGLAACRQLVQADRFVRAGKWTPQQRMPAATRFSRKRCGILGLGRIGTQLGKRLEGFGSTIGFYDPLPKPDAPYTAYESAVALAQDSDIMFLAAAGGNTREPIVSRAVLEALGPQGVFVNVARGWLVDELALIELLASRKLGAAGLDVFAHEPHVPPELLALDNVVVSPHIASSTEECQRAMGECVLDNLRSWFRGDGAVTPVP